MSQKPSVLSLAQQVPSGTFICATCVRPFDSREGARNHEAVYHEESQTTWTAGEILLAERHDTERIGRWS